jgi:hypothetical protein
MRPAGTRSPSNALGREVIYLTVTTLRTPASLPRLQAGDYVVHMPVGLTVETGLDGMADEMARHQRR